VLSPTPIEVLRSIVNPSVHMVAVAQLAERRARAARSQGNSRYVYLSGARTEMPPPLVLEKLVSAATQDVFAAVARRRSHHLSHAFSKCCTCLTRGW